MATPETIKISELGTFTPTSDDILVAVDRADGVTKRADISELPGGGGSGDMLASTYDPAGGARQVSFSCTTQTAITDYTFTGSEARDSGYLVTTASNRTVNISADLFSTGYEVSICKGTNNANTVTLDAQTGNNINGSQTFVLTQYNEVVTLLKDGADTWKIKNHYYPISGTNTGDETVARINTLYGTSNAITVGSIELGHATDTTLTRVSAGKIAAEGVNVGTEGILQNSQSTAYTLVLTDAGKHIYHPSADTTARTWTIPANGSVAFPIGTAVTFINDTSAGTLTISITTDTLVLAGAGTTGSRTLTANGVATAVKVTSTRWIISGTNLT